MKFAYLSSPGPFGLFAVFRNLRTGLAEFDTKLRWVGHGTWAVRDASRPRWIHELPHGEIVGGDSEDYDLHGKLLVQHLIDHQYDGVFINPPQNQCQINVVRYLPKEMTRIMIVHSNAIGVFPALRGLRENVHAAVGVSPGVREGLIKSAGYDASRTFAIPNGLDISPYNSLPPREPSDTLRLLSFGRIEEQQKGVFWLPKIMAMLADVDVHLTIAGTGANLDELKTRCAPFGNRVTFAGLVEPADIPQLVRRHDVFIFPSRYEGFGYTLIEAMAAGCVPVSSRIKSVTDFIIRDGENGRLFDIGDYRTAADIIRSLAADRTLLASLSRNATQDSHARFSGHEMGRAYSDLIANIRANPPQTADPLPLDQWDYPPSFRSGFARFIPKSVKTLIRSKLRMWT